MQKWEYKIISLGWEKIKGGNEYIWSDTKERAVEPDAIETRLNDLGKEGWELTGIETITSVTERYDDGVQVISAANRNYYLKNLPQTIAYHPQDLKNLISSPVCFALNICP
jgi:Domain of unknown function (DUF4177)